MEDKKLKEKLIEIVASALSDNDVRPRVKEIFNALEEAGYVKLADDQSLPDISPMLSLTHPTDYQAILYGYSEAQQDMLEANFKRVILGFIANRGGIL